MTGKGRAGSSVRGPALPDLAYIVRPGEDNEELRYSLRSVAANVSGYRKVWIVGTVPSWVRNVEALPLEPLPSKFANIRQSVTALCLARGVARTVIVFNDDLFVTDPVDATAWPVCHLGPAEKYAQYLISNGLCGERNTWLVGIRSTAEWLAQQGHADPLAYEAHTPLPFDRAKLAAALAEYPADRPLAYPELYRLAGAGGEGVNAGNAKVASLDHGEFEVKVALPVPFLSSNDRSFTDGMVGGYLRGMFREPSRFEEV